MVVDADVQMVIEFMLAEIRAARLVAVAVGLARLAPVLRGEYQPNKPGAGIMLGMILWRQGFAFFQASSSPELMQQ